MNPHFFTAPFYFAFIWFRVQGSGFKVEVAASPPFLEDSILMRAASRPRQIERENEMIVISHRLFYGNDGVFYTNTEYI